MRTLIDIQDGLIEDLLKETRAKTKKEAITTAIETYLNMKRRKRLVDLAGNFDFGYTQEDLQKMRADE